MLLGRLGLDSARVPHADRHGLLGLDCGQLFVKDGCLRFLSGGGLLSPGEYSIPQQGVSVILLGPGSSVTHDALRILAFHGTALIACGHDGVRCYTAPPLPSGESLLARKQLSFWSDLKGKRIEVARKMYAWRLGEMVPHANIAALRGIEGARMKQTYRLLANQFGVRWRGRKYDRTRPEVADLPNQAINHAATAVEAAATIAVYATATIPQIGFIHEDASIAFILDIADLFRDEVTIPIAFSAVKKFEKDPHLTIDQHVRRLSSLQFKSKSLISSMIDRIKNLFKDDF